MTYFFNNLIALTAERNLTLHGVSLGAGLPPSTLSRYVKRGPDGRYRTATVAAVSKFFGVSAEDMVSREILPPVSPSVFKKIVPAADIENNANADNIDHDTASERVPLFTSDELLYHVQKAGDITVEDLERVEKMVPAPPFARHQSDLDLFAYRVQNDAMLPILPRGAIVYFRALAEHETPRNGSLVIAATKTLASEIHYEMGDAPFVTVRKFMLDDCGRVWLLATNPTFPEQEKIIPGGRIFGLVVAWSVDATTI